MSRRAQGRFLWVMLGPAVSVYALFVLVPAFSAFSTSLTRWDGLRKPEFVGLSNFLALLSPGSDFWNAARHNLYLMVVPGSITIVLALFFAYSLHQNVRGARLFRVAFFFPNVISSVAVAMLWVLIYSTGKAGLLNNLLRTFLGPEMKPIPFTQSDRLLGAIVPMAVWTTAGFYMVLFLAAMQNIPTTYYEAAHLDGAGSARTFFKITLPLMWDVLTTGILFAIIGGLKFFDSVWVMENGRPKGTTHTISTLMYSRVFEEYDIGMGTAIAVLLFLLVLAITAVVRRAMKREPLEY
jgi:ABC-type sugar transport system permease subunit